jgi:MFS family permease
MFELHAASCAGDALVAIGLAGTIFFNVPVGDARGRVALYLLVTMAPFALLAPLVGPVLDRFRHGRRYALATTMLVRGFLAYVIASDMGSWVLYPAAFAVLVMSRAYGVARSAAVPRVLPAGMTLVTANARGSLFGTLAGAVVVPIGIGLADIGPQWALGAALVPFAIGMVIALRLPPRADSEAPETVPRLFQLPGHRTSLTLFDTPVWTAVTATGALRALYGFLTLFFAFRTREDDLGLPDTVALGLIVAALGLGSFTSTIVGTRVRLRHPLPIQLGTLIVVATACLGAALGYSLPAAVALAFVTALGSGLAKLGVDAVIQERLPDETRASAFAHSETLLQLAWVLGGALGLAPLSGRWGLLLAALGIALATARVGTLVWSLRVKHAHPRPVA